MLDDDPVHIEIMQCLLCICVVGMKSEHYLPNIQIPRCAQDKDPLCVPRSAGRVKNLPAVLVHELAILDHNLIVLSLFLQAQENILWFISPPELA
jgi:hypothetical protein